jgi:hypothetical protein
MSGLIISRRTLIQGLFVAPAIVAAANIMPIKAIEKITLSDFNPDKTKWVLIGKSDGSMNPTWMRASEWAMFHKRDVLEALKTTYLDTPLKYKNEWGDAIINLQRVYPAGVAVTGLPSSMVSFADKVTGFEATVKKDRWIIGA